MRPFPPHSAMGQGLSPALPPPHVPMGRPHPQVLRVSRRVLGGRVWGWALRGSVYGHFVGGDSPRQLQATAQRLRDLGLRPLLALPSEDEGQHRG